MAGHAGSKARRSRARGQVQIGNRACVGVDIECVARAYQMYRETLVKGFITQVGRTPKEKIHRVRLKRAKHLLATTNLLIQIGQSS